METLIGILGGKKSALRKKFPEIDRDSIVAFIHTINQYDPTGDNAVYTPFIAKQIKFGIIDFDQDGRMEDGGRMQAALEFFHRNKDKSTWTASKNIHDFRDWKELEKIKTELGTVELKSAGDIEREFKAGGKKVFELTAPDKNQTSIRVYEVTTPEAAIAYGRGTVWCTSCSLFKTIDDLGYEKLKAGEDPKQYIAAYKHKAQNRSYGSEGGPFDGTFFEVPDDQFVSYVVQANGGELPKPKDGSYKLPNNYIKYATDQAKNYLETGPLYVVMKKSSGSDWVSYLQITSDGQYVLGPEDQSFARTAPSTDYLLSRFALSGKAPDGIRDRIQNVERAKCKTAAYDGMLPHGEACKCRGCKIGVSDRIRQMAKAGEEPVWDTKRDAEYVKKNMANQ